MLNICMCDHFSYIHKHQGEQRRMKKTEDQGTKHFNYRNKWTNERMTVWMKEMSVSVSLVSKSNKKNTVWDDENV